MSPLLEVAIKAALAAGDEIMRVYAEPFEKNWTSPQGPCDPQVPGDRDS